MAKNVSPTPQSLENMIGQYERQLGRRALGQARCQSLIQLSPSEMEDILDRFMQLTGNSDWRIHSDELTQLLYAMNDYSKRQFAARAYPSRLPDALRQLGESNRDAISGRMPLDPAEQIYPPSANENITHEPSGPYSQALRHMAPDAIGILTDGWRIIDQTVDDNDISDRALGKALRYAISCQMNIRQQLQQQR